MNMNIMNDGFSKASDATFNANYRIASSFDRTAKFMEDELQKLSGGYVPNYKGVMAAAAQATKDVVESGQYAVVDLDPKHIKEAAEFVRSNSDWLAKNNINLVENMNELDNLNHLFLKSVMEFSDVIHKIK